MSQNRVTSQEEQQRLLDDRVAEGDSEDEFVLYSQPPVVATQETIHEPPPSYIPATLTPNSVQAVARDDTAPEIIMMPSSLNQIPMSEPPKYSMHAPPTHLVAQSTGYPVQVQMDGCVVPAMLVQDPTGKHMVYISEQPSGGQPTTDNGVPKKPNDYIGLAVLGLVACCFPFGLIALIKALEVQRRYKQGDYAGAAAASRQAYNWGTSAVVFGITMIVVFFVMKLYFTDHHTRYYY